MLPAWGYDLSSDYAQAGHHFLAFVVGMILTGVLVRRVWRPGTRTLLVSGCVMAGLDLAGVGEAPPGSLPFRMALIFLVGVAAGLLHAGLFEAILPAQEGVPAVSLNLGGICFGGGSIICALLVSSIYWAVSVQSMLLLLAIVPAIFAVFYWTRRYTPRRLVAHPRVLSQFRSGAAVLFSLLLFFQFGNEWSIAGWLPLFLIHRLGMSPVGALRLLALYFAALTAGRIGMSYLVQSATPRRILGICATASLAGCLILSATNNRLGASVSIILIGFGFAPIYPLVTAWIGLRFPYYHPGFSNGIFSIALAGGMLTPWIIGEIAAHAGMTAMIAVPAAGTCAVVLLLFLIWLEKRVTGE